MPVQDGTNCGQGAWNSLNIRAYIIDFPVGRVVEGIYADASSNFSIFTKSSVASGRDPRSTERRCTVTLNGFVSFALPNMPMAAIPLCFLLVEDQTVFRELLHERLQVGHPGCKIVEIATFAEAITQSGLAYDAMIVDLDLVDENCLDWALDWHRNENRPQIVIFSSLSEDNVRYLALHSAIPGFVHKIDIKEAFHLAIETVCCGGAFFSPTARRIRAGTRLSFESYGNVLSVQAEEVR